MLLLVNVRGNSATADKLKTARNIKLQGAVSGNANFDGNEDIIINVMQANIAVIEGEMTLTANDSKGIEESTMKQTTKTINYPSGFNSSNCIVIGVEGKHYTDKPFVVGDTSGSNLYTFGTLTGAIPKVVQLGSEEIILYAYNYAPQPKTFYYKLILMKVS